MPGERHPGVAGGEGVAGECRAQLANGADVAGHHLGHVVLAIALGQVKLAQALGLIVVDVVDFAVGLHGSAEDAEHGQLAHERVGCGLEDQRRHRAGTVGADFIIPGGLGSVGRGRQEVANDPNQFVHSDILRCRGEQDRNKVAVANGFPRAGGHLGGGDLLAFQVLVGKGIVGFGYRFDEALAGRVEIADDAGWEPRRAGSITLTRPVKSWASPTGSWNGTQRLPKIFCNS